MRFIYAAAVAAFVLLVGGVARAEGWAPPPQGYLSPDQIEHSAEHLSRSASQLASALSQRPTSTSAVNDANQLARSARRFEEIWEHGGGNRNIQADFDRLRNRFDQLRLSFYQDRGLAQDPGLRRQWYGVVTGFEDLGLTIGAPPAVNGQICQAPQYNQGYGYQQYQPFNR